MRNISILSVLLIFVVRIGLSQSYSIDGYVKSYDNSLLIGATIYDKSSKKGTITNEQGYYRLNVKNGNHNLIVSYVGYKSLKVKILVTDNIEQNFKLKLSTLDQVTILTPKQNIHLNPVQNPMEMDMVSIKSIPSIIGEPDIMKALALLPGISLTSEVSSNLSIRGASHGQNLIILDEAPIYKSTHLFGFISPFNYSAIKDVKVYKNAIPAKYGGKLSSVIELHSNNGNPDSTQLQYTYGMLNTGFSLSTPIIKDKLTFFAAGRTFYAGIITLPLYVLYMQNKAEFFATYYLYDINSNIKYTPNDHEEFGIYLYSGIDKLPGRSHPEINDLSKENRNYLTWGNHTVSMKYKLKLNQNSFFKNHFTFSKSFNKSFFGYFDDKNPENNRKNSRLSSLNSISTKSFIERYQEDMPDELKQQLLEWHMAKRI